MATETSTPLQIAQRLKAEVSSLRPGSETKMHADIVRAANLLIAAVPLISQCREELFDSHQINGEIVVTDEIDRDAIRTIDYMDHWLCGDASKSSAETEIESDALSVLKEVLELADADGAITANFPHEWVSKAHAVIDKADAIRRRA